MGKTSLAPGLLLAAPRLGDPNFERSVVLLAQHDGDGALGWVLNGKAIAPVERILRDADLVPVGVTLPQSGSYQQAARVGGPVVPGSAWVLFRIDTAPDGFDREHELGAGWAITGARSAVEAIGRGDGPREFSLLLGYAGWGPEQVEGEIRAGAWLPASVDDDTFSHLERGADALWNAAYEKSVGTVPMAFTSNTRGTA